MNNYKILLYHGVTDYRSNGVENYNCKHINFKKFEKQISYLKKNTNVISFNELIFIYQNNLQIPKNTTLITFDDGFKNNYEIAAPILDKYSLPAIFYITSGFIGKNIFFWVDHIENCINLSKNNFFYLLVNNKYYVINLKNKINKINSINLIKKLCKFSAIDTKDLIIKELMFKTGIKDSKKKKFSNYKTMNQSEIKKLSDNSLFTIGGHTQTHNIMSYMSNKELHNEIYSSLRVLKKITLKDVIYYSYPEGQKEHFNKNVIKIMKSLGILSSPTAIKGNNNLNTNLFYLKRFPVEIDGCIFPFNLKS